MGVIQDHPPVMMVLVAFSRHDEALDWARDWGQRQWGPVALESARFPFEETDYYAKEMGAGLKKTIFAFQQLVVPEALIEAKHSANAAEADYARRHHGDESRPLNLDPGYLTESKFLLASSKNHAHRIYLGQGVYAEITLRYQRKAWQPWDWTYPDFRRDDYRQFLLACRTEYRRLKTRHE